MPAAACSDITHVISDDMALIALAATDDVPAAACSDITHVVSDDMAVIALATTDDVPAAACSDITHVVSDDMAVIALATTDDVPAAACADCGFSDSYDFTINTDEGEVNCHKAVLLASGSYHKNIIKQNTNSYYEPNIKRPTLVKLVDWLHCRTVTINDVCIEDLIAGATIWNLEDLLQNCVDYMSENMNINNVCLCYRLSSSIGCLSDILDKCSSFIGEHYDVLNSTKQLEKLTLSNFCEIISYNEINVTNKKVILDSVSRVLQTVSNFDILRMCYMDTSKFTEITHWDFVDMRMRYTRYNNLAKGNKYNKLRQRRFWEELLYINSNYNLCQYDIINRRWIELCALTKSEVDTYTAVAMSDNRMVMVGGESHKRITLLHAASWDMKIPELPTQMPGCGVTMEGNNIFIVGGQTDSHPESYLNSAFCVEIRHDHGKLDPVKISPMKYSMASPLVVIHRGILYVIGGINNTDNLSNTRVQALDLTRSSADWKSRPSIPKRCDNTNSGVVIWEEKITVLTTEYSLIYDDVINKWSVEQYECQGDVLKPVVYRKNICAFVQKGGQHCVKLYDKILNTWEIMIADVPNVLFTGSIMTERRYVV